MSRENDMDDLAPLKGLLEQHGRKRAFRETLTQVSQDYRRDKPLQNRLDPKKHPVYAGWERLKINLLAAASVAVLTAFCTLWLSGYYKNLEKNSSNFRELRRDMNNVKRNVIEHNMVIRGMSGETETSKTPNNFGATGFMLSADGYVVTNYHVIADADSVHLQNANGQSFKASVIHTDQQAELALLQIMESTFTKMKPTPYTFARMDSELGEDVFTLGFPRDEAVYGQGYLSSMSGYKGDTTAYQISIPLNPGNSGGPLLDSRGNVIGIISGKQAGLDGTSFAIKTSALLESIEQISNSSPGYPAIQLNKRNTLARVSRVEQIKRIQNYVFMVKVF